MKNNKGLSILEALIAAVLLSIVFLGAYGVLITGNNMFTRDSAILDMEQQTRNALDRIIREVRQASSQTITANFSGTTNDKIVFTIPQAVGIQYYLNGTNLVREYPSGTVRNIASNIALLKFTLTGSLLKIQVRADKSMYSQNFSFPLTGNVRLRNE